MYSLVYQVVEYANTDVVKFTISPLGESVLFHLALVPKCFFFNISNSAYLSRVGAIATQKQKLLLHKECLSIPQATEWPKDLKLLRTFYARGIAYWNSFTDF